MQTSRKLAAIMFTDIEGYTALMQQNEEHAIITRKKHRDIFNSTTEEYNGTILQYFGDGTLSIFDSAIDAVECAIKMQLGFLKDPAISVRIGIHTGDIVHSEEEIIGDGVNVASRIESLSVPGSIFISGKVYDEVKNHEAIQTTFLKEFKLKNVEKRVEVYAISNEGLVVPEASSIVGINDSSYYTLTEKRAYRRFKKTRNIVIAVISVLLLSVIALLYFNVGKKELVVSDSNQNSIAVLAFENMSGDSEQDYFSDGISEEILNSLSNVEGLKVAGRTSAFSFKGKNEDIRGIGEKLDVKMVLEGSVRKFGNRVRVTAQLINVEDGFHIWSETYDKELVNIFAIQEEIAMKIADKLKLQFQLSKLDKRNTSQHVEAHDFLLKGMFFFTQSVGGVKKAMECFQKAVAIDSNYAAAYAWIGDTYIRFSVYGLLNEPEAYAKARSSALKAISINPTEPRAHKVLAYVNMNYDWDWSGALDEYKIAIKNGLPDPDHFITLYQIFVNKDFEKAIAACEEIVKRDPIHVRSHWHLGIANFFAKRFDQALISFNNALELDPNYGEGHRWKGATLCYLKKYEESMKSLEKSLEITKGQGPADLDIMVLYIKMGKGEQVLERLKKLDIAKSQISPMGPALLYSLLGKPDEAIAWLERGFRERSFQMVSLKFYWVWDPIRKHPRFIDIYNRMKFPD